MENSDHIDRAAIRRLLERIFRTASELDAFCLDYFPHVKSRFSNEMDRTTKLNILLEYVEPVIIFNNLKMNISMDFKKINRNPLQFIDYAVPNQIANNFQRYLMRIFLWGIWSMISILLGWIAHSISVVPRGAMLTTIDENSPPVNNSFSPLGATEQRNIEWLIDSNPPRAQIIRKKDNIILGVTPWHYEQIGDYGYEEFVIKSYRGSEIKLLLGKNSNANILLDFTYRKEVQNVPLLR